MGSSQLHFVSCSVTFARDPQRRSHPLPGEICQPAGSSGCGSRPPAALAALQLPIGPVPPPRCIRFPFTEPRSTLWALKTRPLEPHAGQNLLSLGPSQASLQGWERPPEPLPAGCARLLFRLPQISHLCHFIFTQLYFKNKQGS